MGVKKYLKERKYFIIAIFYLILQIVVLIRHQGNYLNFLWLCNFAPILFAVFFFMKKLQIIKSLISLTIVVDLFFLVDFFTSLIFNFGIFGQVQPYFQEGILLILLTVLLHLTGFIALFVTHSVEPSKKTLWFSAAFLVLTYVVTLLFSPANSYYNYILGTRPGYVSPGIPQIIITVLWPLLSFIFIVLPGYYFQLLIHRLQARKK